MLEFVATGNDLDAAAAVAAELGGVSYTAAPDDPRELPFRALVRAETDDIRALEPAAGVGSYLIFSRVIRARPEPIVAGEASTGVTAVFPMLRHQDLEHHQSDAHWRDIHAPLAQIHHPGMWDYTQLSITHSFSGPALDGFALCSFASAKDLKERFFTDDEARAIIHADVASFANPDSPRRVVATETIYGARPPARPPFWPND
ncbi:MAG: hypothetical protein ACI8Y4_002579 [Candidatus Poriferisodalaceae bacterium]|jgi:hypothetical protein